jgi:hypothetical protein
MSDGVIRSPTVRFAGERMNGLDRYIDAPIAAVLSS